MVRAILFLLDKYGLQVGQLGLILYLAWKFHNNHLKHINDELKKNSEKLDILNEKVGDLSERVSKLEGKIE